MRTRLPEDAPVTLIPGASAVEDATDMVFALDQQGRMVFANRTAESFTGRSRADLLGRPFADLVSDPDTWAPGEVGLTRSDGSVVWVEVSTWASGGQVWGIARDVTERRQEIDLLRHKAFHDPLTGLPNRDLFSDRLEQALNVARRTGRPLTLMIVDLDRFKQVNDSYGHPCGDEVLRLIAARIRQTLRASDTVARLGGDEFGVLLPEEDAEKGTHVAMKLQRVLREPLRVGGVVCRLDASVGLATYPEDGIDAPTLVATADAAMYGVKRGGGRAFVVSRHGRSISVPVVATGSPRRTIATLAVALLLAVAWIPGGSSLRPGSPAAPFSAPPGSSSQSAEDGSVAATVVKDGGSTVRASLATAWWREMEVGPEAGGTGLAGRSELDDVSTSPRSHVPSEPNTGQDPNGPAPASAPSSSPARVEAPPSGSRTPTRPPVASQTGSPRGRSVPSSGTGSSPSTGGQLTMGKQSKAAPSSVGHGKAGRGHSASGAPASRSNGKGR
jgi:diguanylate cyclase (GGDEF)-like protein